MFGTVFVVLIFHSMSVAAYLRLPDVAGHIIVGIFIWAIAKFIQPYLFRQTQDDDEIPHDAEEIINSPGHCLAFAYYENYLRHILPELHKRIHKYKSKAENELKKETFINKLYVLVPDSGKVDYDIVTDADSHSVFHGILEPYKCDNSGRLQREYPNSVYRIENSDYCCVVEFATPLMSLYHMWEDDVIDRQTLKHLINTFHGHLTYLLQKHKATTQDACRVILYSDTGEPHLVSKAIMEALHEHCDYYC